MPIEYQPNGNLKIGIHLVTWDELVKEYGFNQRRLDLLNGLSNLIEDLKTCGCTILYIDGSFVTKKRNPGDYDACWREYDENHCLIKPGISFRILLEGTKEEQRLKYGGDIRAAFTFADYNDNSYLEFFQRDKGDKSKKGILQLNIK